jgi:hypothetical protein
VLVRKLLWGVVSLASQRFQSNAYKEEVTLIRQRGLCFGRSDLCCRYFFFRCYGIDHNCFPSAFRGRGVDRIQVDAFGGEFV